MRLNGGRAQETSQPPPVRCLVLRRLRLEFARGCRVWFSDREAALERIREIAERGSRLPITVYGPEGCGKTTLLRQAAILLEDMGYKVVYVNPNESSLEKAVEASSDVRSLAVEVFRELLPVFGDYAKAIAHLVLAVAPRIARRFHKPRVALLVDDVFQAIGAEASTVASYVKSALNLIEYPDSSYERILVIIASSEGASRRELGRHMWSYTYMVWNMSRRGFAELYDQLPGPKPDFEEVWRFTGGNPRLLGVLYENNWDVDTVVELLARSRGLAELVAELEPEELEALNRAVEDIDYLWANMRTYKQLVDRLVDLNLVVTALYDRNPRVWLDEPPPEYDPEIGVGRYMAWQTPLHREAVRRILERGSAS